MAHYGDPIPLVPGDDWALAVYTLDETGDEIDFSAWTVTFGKVEWSGGEIEVEVDLSTPGRAMVTATDADTADLPFGKVSKLNIKAQSPGGEDRTIVFKEVNGVRTLSATEATVQILGTQGNPGLNWRDDVNGGEWLTATAYVVDDAVYHDGSSYRAIAAYTSGASTEPGVGADWEDYWSVLALGSDVDSVAAVAAIAGQIVTVASIAGQITTLAPYAVAIGAVAMNIAEVVAVAGIAASVPAVAAIDAEVALVAGSIGNVNIVAGGLANINIAAINIAGILAAPQAVIDAGTYRDQALAAKDESAANALSTAGLKATVDTIYANLVTLYSTLGSFDPTLAQLTGAAKRIVAAADVVAVFVYDTTKDSDGGTWRARADKVGSITKETLNTATRGSRATHPQKWLIVARAASVTIYDLDDAACPMWTVFQTGTSNILLNVTDGSGAVTSVRAVNGILVVGLNQNGVRLVDFVGDTSLAVNSAGRYAFTGRLVNRNSQAVPYLAMSLDASVRIVNSTVNWVDAYLVAGTPIDPIRKLPTPTVTVGTAGGASVIHYDGRVTNSSETTNFKTVAFGDGFLIMSAQSGYFGAQISTFAEIQVNSFGGSSATRLYTTPQVNFAYPKPIANSFSSGFHARGNRIVHYDDVGMSLIDFRANVIPTSFCRPGAPWADITTAYNTGWMVGDIKMALAESTADLTSLDGAEVLLNGEFSIDLSNWTSNDGGTGATSAWDSGNGGRMALPRIDVSNLGRRYQSFATVIGAAYRVSATISGNTAIVRVGTAINGSQNANPTLSVGTTSFAFIATATTTFITAFGVVDGVTSYVDAVSLKRAAIDRSVAANHPIVVGTVNRSAVVTGAELAAYGGFSASNYLQVPYSADFDVGTGDFQIECWLWEAPNSATETIFERDSAVTNQRWTLEITAAGLLNWIIDDGTTTVTVTSTAVVDDSRWHHVVAGKRGTVQELWIDGVRVATATAPTLTLNNASAVFRMGESVAGGAPLTNGKITLTRPTKAGIAVPAQIRRKYPEELGLFQIGAKCLLAGSNNVLAAYIDMKTDLLYASKASAGTDVFKGLCRQSTISTLTENSLGAELLTNPSFTTDLTDWANQDAGSGAVSSWDAGNGGRLALPRVNGTNFARRSTSFATVIGQTYQVTVLSGNGGGIGVRAGTAATFQNLLNATQAANALVSYTFVATTTTSFINLYTTNDAATGYVEEASVRLLTTQRMTSNSHKGVHAENDNIAIFTDQEVYVKTPAIGLREAVTRQPVCAPYDRNIIRAPSAAVTTNATPTVIGYLPMDKGEAGEWFIRVSAREYGEPAAPELASYEVRVTVHRPQEGNAAVAGSATYTVVSEVTSSMDLTVAANTTVQALAITGTGVASKNIEWGYEARFAPSVQQVAA